MLDRDKNAQIIRWLLLVLILTVGIIFYLVGNALPDGIEKTFFHDFGVGIFVAGLVGLVVENTLERHLVEKIECAIEPLEGLSGVIQGAELCGVKNIIVREVPHEQRDDPDKVQLWDDRWKRIIADHLEEESRNDNGHIKILCATGADFFKKKKHIQKKLWNRFVDEKSQCELKVLLLDHRSEWTYHRQLLEPGFLTIQENIISKDTLEEMKSGCKKVDFHLFNWLPVALLVITDKAAFIEPYPLVKNDQTQGAIGGWSPMLVLRANTEAYEIWKRHFEYIWDNPFDAGQLQYLIRNRFTWVERVGFLQKYRELEKQDLPFIKLNAEILELLKSREGSATKEPVAYDIFEYVGKSQVYDALKAVQYVVRG